MKLLTEILLGRKTITPEGNLGPHKECRAARVKITGKGTLKAHKGLAMSHCDATYEGPMIT